MLLWFKFGFSIPFAVYALLTSTLLIIALIDFDHKIIPNIITLPGIADWAWAECMGFTHHTSGLFVGSFGRWYTLLSDCCRLEEEGWGAGTLN